MWTIFLWIMMTTFEVGNIAVFATQDKVELYTPYLNKYMYKYNICGKMRQAAFLATIIHESDNFVHTKEIASGRAYEGRKDLGNINKGDGVKYKGRGLIQLTGRANYQEASKAIGVDFINNPELIEQPEYAVMVSCWWWNDKGLNEIADSGNIRAVTKKVNGGYNGINNRTKYYNLALKVLS